jgi:hypothetical protein
MVNDFERVGEPIDFQHAKDIMQVETPSSTTTRLMVYLEYSMWIWKATWYGKRGFTSVTLNLMIFETLGSMAPKAESKAFLYDGDVWDTSKEDIAQGVWPKS